MTKAASDQPQDESRRDFCVLTASAAAGVGAACTAWPLIDSLNPAKDVLALATAEVDISAIQPGQSLTVMWRGKPVFIRHRTAQEIAEAKAVSLAKLPDPQADSDRVKPGKEQWLVTVGICTHLGCVPLGKEKAGYKGEFDGWFCPCHGSHYDSSGRIRKGPAPENLKVPPYEFVSDTLIRIG